MIGWDDIESIDKLKFSHKMCFISTKKYLVENMDGENILTVKESKRFKYPNGRLRPLNMEVIDRDGNVLFYLRRKFSLGQILRPKLNIFDDDGPIGSIEKTGKGSLLISTASESLLIKGDNAWRYRFFSNGYFTIMTNDDDKDEIGEICKSFKGPQSEVNSYKVIFPIGLDAKLKALIISCCVFIVSIIVQPIFDFWLILLRLKVLKIVILLLSGSKTGVKMK